MTVKLPAEIAEAVEAISRSSGVAADRLVADALRAHFPPIDASLQADFDFWDEASARSEYAIDQLLEDDA